MPKTIDNDLGATYQTFGFDTALQIPTEAIGRLHTTAESHRRTLIVEVMGATPAGSPCTRAVAGGADVILVPEPPFDIDEVCRLLHRRVARGRMFSIVVVAEGAVAIGGDPGTTGPRLDEFGHVRLGGIGHWLEGEIERRTGFEARATVLGHTQRGGRRARSTACSPPA